MQERSWTPSNGHEGGGVGHVHKRGGHISCRTLNRFSFTEGSHSKCLGLSYLKVKLHKNGLNPNFPRQCPGAVYEQSKMAQSYVMRTTYKTINGKAPRFNATLFYKVATKWLWNCTLVGQPIELGRVGDHLNRSAMSGLCYVA